VRLHELATDDPHAFERAAIATGTNWLAELRTSVDPARLTALDAWLRMPRTVEEVVGWFTVEGREARWAVVHWCLQLIRELPRYGTYYIGMSTMFRLAMLAGEPAVEAPWLWVELFAAVPGHKRLVAHDLQREARVLRDDLVLPAIEHVLRTWPPFPHRGILARQFEAAGRVTPDLAIRWLADPALRPIGEELLRPRVGELEARLRELLGDAAGGTREALVRLLRTVDDRIALDGTTEATDDAELQARLRADPWDATTSMVWADLLGTRGDPRGDHLSLEHAIATAEPERALELSHAQAALCRDHRKQLWNRPGGFPFREKYRGRELVAFGSDWNHKIRGKLASIVDRVQDFANHVTDVAGPAEVHFGRVRDLGAIDAVAREPRGDLEASVLDALGGASLFEGPFARRANPADPLADDAAFRALCVAHPTLTLIYRFQLTWPGTRILLPHQEGEHYSGGEPLSGRLAIYLDDSHLSLVLKFPYEGFDSEGFVTMYEAIGSTLGRVLTPSRFQTIASSADCKRMVSRLAKFDRPVS
jgi:hypothetical protein